MKSEWTEQEIIADAVTLIRLNEPRFAARVSAPAVLGMFRAARSQAAIAASMTYENAHAARIIRLMIDMASASKQREADDTRARRARRMPRASHRLVSRHGATVFLDHLPRGDGT